MSEAKDQLKKVLKEEHEANVKEFAQAYNELCAKHKLQLFPKMILVPGEMPQVIMETVVISE